MQIAAENNSPFPILSAVYSRTKHLGALDDGDGGYMDGAWQWARDGASPDAAPSLLDTTPADTLKNARRQTNGTAKRKRRCANEILFL